VTASGGHIAVVPLNHLATSAWQAFDWLAVRWMIRKHRKDGSRRLNLLKEVQVKLDEALKL